MRGLVGGLDILSGRWSALSGLGSGRGGDLGTLLRDFARLHPSGGSTVEQSLGGGVDRPSSICMRGMGGQALTSRMEARVEHVEVVNESARKYKSWS